MAGTIKINPNASRAELDSTDLNDHRNYPKFTKSIQFHKFRHLEDILIEFKHPISVISGSNKSGKSTVLMALACSHYNFQRRNPVNGKLERQTWGSMMKFSGFDIQTVDWSYEIVQKVGYRRDQKNGQRKVSTKKWSGVAKKESQIKDRQVVFIDLDRILPARFFNRSILQMAKHKKLSSKASSLLPEIQSYISYIFESDFTISKVAEHLDKQVFGYQNGGDYTSFNSSSGEDVVTRIIKDSVEADREALILIDEVELGLHPKVQRRLMDIFYEISKKQSKQFILTTHSATVLSSVVPISRVFIDHDPNDKYTAVSEISINAALSKMDVFNYPLVEIFVEDNISARIVKNVLALLSDETRENLIQSFNIITVGSASEVYNTFVAHKKVYAEKKIKTGYAAILDGDMQSQLSKSGNRIYPDDDFLFFLFGDIPPEKELASYYLEQNPNRNFEYHFNYSNVHCLLRMLSEIYGVEEHDVINVCWKIAMRNQKFQVYVDALKNFLMKLKVHFEKMH